MQHENIFAHFVSSAVYAIRYICYGCTNIDLSWHERKCYRVEAGKEEKSLNGTDISDVDIS